MKVRTLKGILVKLDAIPWSAKMFNLLLQLQLLCPNLRVEAVEMHTGKLVRVPLFQLELVWTDCNRYNIPG